MSIYSEMSNEQAIVHLRDAKVRIILDMSKFGNKHSIDHTEKVANATARTSERARRNAMTDKAGMPADPRVAELEAALTLARAFVADDGRNYNRVGLLEVIDAALLGAKP